MGLLSVSLAPCPTQKSSEREVQSCSAKCSVRLTTHQLNITEQHSTLLNKCSVLFSEMFSTFDRGLKSQKDGRVLPIFQLEITDPTEAEALISQNLVCNVTGIVFKAEEFRAPTSVMQCHNCQSFGHSAKTCRSKQKCLICGESHSHKGCLSRELRKPTCTNCKGPHVASYKGCPEYKKQAFRQHVVSNQKSYAYASVLHQNTLLRSKPTQAFAFTA